MSAAAAGRLGPRDALRVASVGLRARPLRAALSALGIAIGTAAIVAILGLSSSSQAGLLAEIDRLGTNLLTVEAGQRLKRDVDGGQAFAMDFAPNDFRDSAVFAWGNDYFDKAARKCVLDDAKAQAACTRSAIRASRSARWTRTLWNPGSWSRPLPSKVRYEARTWSGIRAV